MRLLPFFGIDLGTTNTVIASSYKDRANLIDSRVINFKQKTRDSSFNRIGHLPSVIFFDNNNKIIIGDFAKHIRGSQPNRVIFNSKRFMGTSSEWCIANYSFNARDAATEILKICKDTILQMFGISSPKDLPIVITHPASFNTDQSADTKNAAINAGFDPDKITLLHEPVAALIDFVNTQTNQNELYRKIDFWTKKRVMVYDLGGGTCDVCIVDVELKEKDKIDFVEIGTGRYSEFGGSDFDECCATFLLNNFLKDNKIKERQITDSEINIMKNKLNLFCEEAKEYFSNEFQIYGYDESKVDSFEKNISEFYLDQYAPFSLTKKKFDLATDKLYYAPKKINRDYRDKLSDKNIETPIIDTIRKYNIDINSIDFIYMTGGMTQYQKIQKRVMEIIDKQVIIAEDPISSIAKGASIYGHFMVSQEKNSQKYVATEKNDEIFHQIKLVSILAESIMMDVANGLPIEIISKNQKLPFEGIMENIFKVASPSGIKIDIYAGEDVYDSKMRVQRSYSKRLDIPVIIGTPMDVEFKIDKNKNLELKAIIKGDFNQEIPLYCESLDVQTNEIL